MTGEQLIDEAALERRCVALIQRSERGGYSGVPGAEGPDADVMTRIALGWMYMDLQRAVAELRAAVALQRPDGLIPRRVGEARPVTPLLASLVRMVYHAARGRMRALEGDLARLVEPLDRHNALLAELSRGRLLQLDPRGGAPGGGEAVAEVGFNALQVQAETDLADVALHTGYPTRKIIARRTHLSLALSQRLWWAEAEVFASRRGRQWLTPLSTDSLLPLWSGAAPRHQATPMIDRYLAPGRGFWRGLPVASALHPDDAPLEAEGEAGAQAADGAKPPRLDPWTVWLLIRAMMRYGYPERAAQLNDTLLRLASAPGLFEAYDAESGAGLGVSEHPVTAAVVLDLIKTPYTYERW